MDPVRIAQLARAVGWDPVLIPTVLAVSKCESSWDPAIVGGAEDCCVGLMQVNYRAHGYTIDQLRDAAFNLKAAHTIYKREGPGAWDCWANGAYIANMTEASGIYIESLTGAPIATEDPIDVLTGLGGDVVSGAVDAAQDAASSAMTAAVRAAGLDNLPRKLLVLGVGMVLLSAGVGLVGLGMYRLTGSTGAISTVTDTAAQAAGIAATIA